MQKTLAVIDLNAIYNNALHMRKLAGGSQFMAVVKADAYGHGAERVCLHIEDIVDGFCVAITEEGEALRIAGITKPVLVLTPLTAVDDALAAKYYGLTVTVNGVAAAGLCAGLGCHIKVNTGMNRYGCNPRELAKVIEELGRVGARVEGVYSHLYCPHILSERERQYAVFLSAARAVKSAYPGAIAHLSASAGTFIGGKYLMDGVRCGIALYGYAPSGFSRGELQSAMKVYARKVQTSPAFGGGAGYAVARKSYRALSAYRLGYADGFARTVSLGEGNLCMDAFVSQDECEFFPVFDDADKYAARCGTISYEVLCAATRRAERFYIA